MTNPNAAILYLSDEYHTAKNRIMGRHSANEGFLSGFAHHAAVETAFSHVVNENQHKAFAQQYKDQGGQAKQLVGIPFAHPEQIARAGCLYIPDPHLAEQAFIRRHIAHDNPERLYSLCGITHTISSDGAMALLRELLLAPLHPWDALICTSRAVKEAVENIIGLYADYLGSHFGHAITTVPCQLPVIPLGIDAQSFLTGHERSSMRERWRSRLGIPTDAVVFLFFGRLSFHAKANPFPMMCALERAAQHTGKEVHLIQAGQFANQALAKTFQEANRALCPSVRCHYLDGGDNAIRHEIWYAADVFTSLVDNIQETFGLTPVEAMAAGLPVVVTDWDGYRDTVEEGKQGFLIPTLMPRAGGVGQELAQRFFQHSDNYDHYIANTANYIGVDIAVTTARYIALIEQPGLREQMGKAARERAVNVYDWQHIIHAYQALWAALSEIRLSPIKGILPLLKRQDIKGINPLAPDPYFIFQGYPSRVVTLSTCLRVTQVQAEMHAARYLGLGVINAGLREDFSLYRQVLGILEKNPGASLMSVLHGFKPSEQNMAERCVARLIKMGLLECLDE